MTFISMFRLVALGLALVLGLVVLGLTAHWLQITTNLINPIIYDFEIVALVAGVLTSLSLSLMLVVDQIRKGAITSMIVVELTTLTVLWVLFLTVGALTAQWKEILYPFGCGDTFELNVIQQGWCREFFAIMGGSFSAWIILLLYTATLLFFALIEQSHGNTVWTASVAEAFSNVQNKELSPSFDPPVHMPAAGAYPLSQQYPVVGTPTGQTDLPQV